LLLHNGNPPLPFDVSHVKPILQLFRVDQQWIMFSNPPTTSFWYVINGLLHNGDEINIFDDEGLVKWHGVPLTYDKPKALHDSFINHRWYKYFENGYTKPQEEVHAQFAGWVCKQWNSKHEQEYGLSTVTVYRVEEKHYLEKSPERLRERFIHKYNCQ